MSLVVPGLTTVRPAPRPMGSAATWHHRGALVTIPTLVRSDIVSLLRSPASGQRLHLSASRLAAGDDVLEGDLSDGSQVHPITAGIPRFETDAGVSGSFGRQWSWWQRVQLDSVNNTTLTHQRLMDGTGWSRDRIGGLRVLDAGCGAGRFSEVLLEWGAEVFAVDITSAVDVCLANLAGRGPLTVLQADLHRLPFQRNVFDAILCYGVLQHTPVPSRAFAALVPHLKSGGWIAVDVYLKSLPIYRWTAKYWYRSVTKRMPASLLRRVVHWYVPKWIRIERRLSRYRALVRLAEAIVPCPLVLSSVGGLSGDETVLWAELDAFDALSAWHDQPQTLAQVRSWFERAGFTDVNVRLGGNGIVATGRKP